jgi:hypothetical protein
MVPDRHVIGRTWEIETTGEPSCLSPPQRPSNNPDAAPSPFTLDKWRQTSSLTLAPSVLQYQTASSIKGASPGHPALPRRTTLSLPLPPLLAFQTTWTLAPSFPLPSMSSIKHHPPLVPSALPHHLMLSIEDACPGACHCHPFCHVTGATTLCSA